MTPPVDRKRRLQGVGGGGGVAGQAATHRGADGVGQRGQHDVEVDVERDGAGEGVEVEGADRAPRPADGAAAAAYNGEAWLAEHFNAYLADPDEHRAILRHLLHLGRRVDYRPAGITLDRCDSPRVAHALELLSDELNATPAHLPGDRRPLTYQLAQP
jgi:hypothetical protein